MADLTAAPLLSTPAEHMFDTDPTSKSALEEKTSKRPHRCDVELFELYEIARTAGEIFNKGWRRVALQFPDPMLPDAGWVVDALDKEIERLRAQKSSSTEEEQASKGRAKEEEDSVEPGATRSAPLEVDYTTKSKSTTRDEQRTRLYVLADTSYSACCVDEIAAEHAHAEAVVHYGRCCLSPTARLPVIYVFTRQTLAYDAVVSDFEKKFSDERGGKKDKIILMADVMFQEHVQPICERLREKGYEGVMATELVRDPGATIPNRRVAADSGELDLHDHHLFHISTPPSSLLLTLSSRLSSLHIFPVPDSPYMTNASSLDPSSTPALLRRRYGLVLRLATAGIIGILVNTLSIQNYLPTIDHLKEQIADAGKKSYTIVVGKLNAAKLANFAEIEGWVVVGCWESGLVEQEGFWRPVITPFELGIALTGAESRVWDGRWWGGIEGFITNEKGKETGNGHDEKSDANDAADEMPEVEGGVDDEESEPPEFDLRTGKLVSHSRPMKATLRHKNGNTLTTTSGGAASASEAQPSSALVQRKLGELAMVNGVASPGAEYLRSQRTWQGLGSDFRDDEDEPEDEPSTLVEEGRRGIAKGYTVGQEEAKT